MEEILAKHRKEKRDLQARITQKKKNATKKTRKGVNDEIERLERELAEKQQAEIEALDPNDPDRVGSEVDGLTLDEPLEGTQNESRTETPFTQPVESPDDRSVASSSQPRAKKPNRQKERLARRAAEQEAQAAAAALDAKNLPDLREQEMTAMKKNMAKLGLVETLIRPDGHCLFSACAYSMPSGLLSQSGPTEQPYENVRHAAANFMAAHPDDFAAFMEEPLDSYVQKIRETAEWGGELELQAIARSYKIPIKVLRADGRIETVSSGMAEEADSNEIWLAYYRHSFGLGEHYNALKKIDKS